MTASAELGLFVETLQQSGLFELAALDAYLNGPSRAAQEPGQLAGYLVRDGLLTEFQARQLLAGKRRGFLLGARYKVLDQIGAGGMAAVYLCEHLASQERVAIKVLPPQQAKDPVALERFRRETRAVSLFDHPNIVRALETGQDGDLHFLVMEHVQGTDLQHLIERGGVLEPARAAANIRQAALALQHAHEAGLVHRDIKPANLLLDTKGVIKVLDLGLARFFNDEQDTLTQEHDSSAILGTADYLAPEQAVDSHDVDIRADIYSLGCTFYFLLCGKAPFQGKSMTEKLIFHQTRPPEPIRSLRPEVPKEMAAVLDRMLAKEPAKRYQTPAEVAEALRAWAPEGKDFYTPSEIVKRRRAAQERRSLKLTIVGGLALLAGLGLFLMLLLRTTAPEELVAPVSTAVTAGDETVNLRVGLKDYWKLDEGTGTVARSSVSGGTPLDLKNGAKWEKSGPFGNAVRLSGSNQYLVPNPDVYELGPTFTFTAWINLSAGARNPQVIVANRPLGAANNGIYFHVNKGDTANHALVLGTGNGVTHHLQFSAEEMVTPGKWHHVGLVYSRPTKFVRVYLNGGEVAMTGLVRYDFATRQITHFGIFPGGAGGFNGSFSDLRLYPRVLSGSEMATLAKMTDAPVPAPEPTRRETGASQKTGR